MRSRKFVISCVLGGAFALTHYKYKKTFQLHKTSKEGNYMLLSLNAPLYANEEANTRRDFPQGENEPDHDYEFFVENTVLNNIRRK